MVQDNLADYFLVTKLSHPPLPAPPLCGWNHIDHNFLRARERRDDLNAQHSESTFSEKNDAAPETNSLVSAVSSVYLNVPGVNESANENNETDEPRYSDNKKLHSSTMSRQRQIFGSFGPHKYSKSLGLLDKTVTHSSPSLFRSSHFVSSNINTTFPGVSDEKIPELQTLRSNLELSPELFASAEPCSDEDPIDDICVIFPKQEEKIPAGYRCLTRTPFGYIADCNDGVIGAASVFICIKHSRSIARSSDQEELYRRGLIVDLKVIFLGKEAVPEGYELIEKSRSGKFSANLNGGYMSQPILLAVKRSPSNRITEEKDRYHSIAPIVDVCVVNVTKKEPIPLGWECLEKSTSDGNWTGNKMFVCIKRSKPQGMLDMRFMAVLADRIPRKDHPDFALPVEVPRFTAPNGLSLVRREITNVPLPEFFSFALTRDDGSEVYCCCFTFYEIMDESTTDYFERSFDAYLDIMKHSESPLIDNMIAASQLCGRCEYIPDKTDQLKPGYGNKQVRFFSVNNCDDGGFGKESEPCSLGTKPKNSEFKIFCPVQLTILGKHPFTQQFKQFLSLLYQVSISKTPMPIESYVGQLLFGLPVPQPGTAGFRLHFGSGDHSISFSLPPVMGFPACSISFEAILLCLNADQIAQLLTLCLLEKNVVLHSRFISVLNNVAEAVRLLMYPLEWRHVFIPVCPTSLVRVLDAPVPFFVGFHKSVMDEIELPPDVWEVDLDNGSIYYWDTIGNASSLPLSTLEKSSLSGHKIDILQAVRTLKKPPTLPPVILTQFLRHVRRAVADAAPLGSPGKCGNGALLAYEPQSPDLAYSMSPLEASNEATSMRLHSAIRDAAVKVMIQLIGGYNFFLLPPQLVTGFMGRIKICPTTLSHIFDLQGFLDASPKNSKEFVTSITRTMSFTRFVDERTFATHLGHRFLFFDALCDDILGKSAAPNYVSMPAAHANVRNRGLRSRRNTVANDPSDVEDSMAQRTKDKGLTHFLSSDVHSDNKANQKGASNSSLLPNGIFATKTCTRHNILTSTNAGTIITFKAGGGESCFAELRQQEAAIFMEDTLGSDNDAVLNPWCETYKYDSFPKLCEVLLWSFLGAEKFSAAARAVNSSVYVSYEQRRHDFSSAGARLKESTKIVFDHTAQRDLFPESSVPLSETKIYDFDTRKFNEGSKNFTAEVDKTDSHSLNSSTTNIAHFVPIQTVSSPSIAVLGKGNKLLDTQKLQEGSWNNTAKVSEADSHSFDSLVRDTAYVAPLQTASAPSMPFSLRENQLFDSQKFRNGLLTKEIKNSTEFQSLNSLNISTRWNSSATKSSVSTNFVQRKKADCMFLQRLSSSEVVSVDRNETSNIHEEYFYWGSGRPSLPPQEDSKSSLSLDSLRRYALAGVRMFEEVQIGQRELAHAFSDQKTSIPKAKGCLMEIVGAWACILAGVIANNVNKNGAWCRLKLISVLSKISSLSRQRMLVLDETACRSALACCSMAGRAFALDASRLYRSLINNDCKPNAVTYGFFTQALAIRNTKSCNNDTKIHNIGREKDAWNRLRTFLWAYIRFKLVGKGKLFPTKLLGAGTIEDSPISLTCIWSATFCANCNLQPLDETIMDGWVASDEQIAFYCPICDFLVVPRLSFQVVVFSKSDEPNGEYNFTKSFAKVQQVEHLNPSALRTAAERTVKHCLDNNLPISADVVKKLNSSLYINMLWYSERLGFPVLLPSTPGVDDINTAINCSWKELDMEDHARLFELAKSKITGKTSRNNNPNPSSSGRNAEGGGTSFVSGAVAPSEEETFKKRRSQNGSIEFGESRTRGATIFFVGELTAFDPFDGYSLWGNNAVVSLLADPESYRKTVEDNSYVTEKSAPLDIVQKLASLMLHGKLSMAVRIFLSARMASCRQEKTISQNATEYGSFIVTRGWESFSNSVYIELYALTFISLELRMKYAPTTNTLEKNLRMVLKQMRNVDPTLNSYIKAEDYPPGAKTIVFRTFFDPLYP